MKEKTIGCVHFGKCPGCVYDSCETAPEIYARAKDFIAQTFGVSLQFKQGNVRAWRTRAKLAVQRDARIGLYLKGTHDVLPIPHCQVHHPLINQAVAHFLEAFQKSTLTLYDEKTHNGDLRYLQCVVERQTNKVQLSFVLNQNHIPDTWRAFCSALYETGLYHSIWINKNRAKTNTIFGKEWEKIAGEAIVWEEIAGIAFAFGPSHFGQANLEMYEELILDMQARIEPNRILAELYAGAGIIGTSLAATSKEVRLSEIESHAKTYFEKAYEKLPRALQQKISYKTGPAEESLELLDGVEVCIVDPPRKGLGTGFTEKLLSQPTLKQLIYVACDWNSIERDLHYIAKHNPEWKLKEAISYLFFPGTNQIETVAYLEKQ